MVLCKDYVCVRVCLCVCVYLCMRYVCEYVCISVIMVIFLFTLYYRCAHRNGNARIHRYTHFKSQITIANKAWKSIVWNWNVHKRRIAFTSSSQIRAFSVSILSYLKIVCTMLFLGSTLFSMYINCTSIHCMEWNMYRKKTVERYGPRDLDYQTHWVMLKWSFAGIEFITRSCLFFFFCS